MSSASASPLLFPRGLDDSEIVQAHCVVGMVRADGLLEDACRFPQGLLRGFETMLVMKNVACDGQDDGALTRFAQAKELQDPESVPFGGEGVIETMLGAIDFAEPTQCESQSGRGAVGAHNDECVFVVLLSRGEFGRFPMSDSGR